MRRTVHVRKDRLIKQKRKDSYIAESKLSEPTVCEICGVVYSNGRWVWKESPADCRFSKCPACRRTQQNYPAGKINLSGSFYLEHRQ